MSSLVALATVAVAAAVAAAKGQTLIHFQPAV
jgi:hypothetical protein